MIQEEPHKLTAKQRALVKESFAFLKKFSKDKIIYGINTGFGPMAQYRISDDELGELQYNLIRSHASGMGAGLPDQYVRAVMLNRLNTLALGGSGVSLAVVEQLGSFIEKGIHPYIPEHGSVGASGDLVQLAHLALGLIGEGKAIYKGELLPVEDVLKNEKLKPLELSLRDGLAMMNGTSCMSGIGLLNVIYATRLTKWAVLIGAVINELVRSYDDSYSEFLNRAKRHKGQRAIAAAMRRCLETSKMVRKREDRLFKDIHKVGNGKRIREKFKGNIPFGVFPQILGQFLKTIKMHNHLFKFNKLKTAL